MPSPYQFSPSASTPAAFVRAILLAYDMRGLSPDKALRQAQISPAQAQQPQGRVRAEQFERLCLAAMQELDDEAPGWFSRPLPWGSYGLLARGSMGAPNLGVALKRWCRHHALLTADVRLHLLQDGPEARLVVHEARPLPPGLREFALLSLLRNLHGLACWWIDSAIALQASAFPFAAPPHAAVYEALFPGPLRFHAPQASLHLHADYLRQPLRRDHAALDALLRRALPLMVLPYRRDRLLAHRVRQRLLADPAQSAEQLAHALGLSARSLHRQLLQEGTRWQALKDQARQQRACQLLAQTSQPIKQVAQASGFASSKSFARAFSRWTGQSPEDWRKRGPA